LSWQCPEERGRVNEYVEEYNLIVSQIKKKETLIRYEIKKLAPIQPMFPIPEQIQQLQKDAEVLRRSMEVISLKAMGILAEMKNKGCKI
jgi:hypothetical protein